MTIEKKTIYGGKIGSPRQRLIIEVVKLYQRQYFAEHKTIVQENLKLKNRQINDFASDKQKEFRVGLNIPMRLFNTLDTLFPPKSDKARFLDKKGELHWMMKTFPEYCIPRKV